jgi:hypothetical protein
MVNAPLSIGLTLQGTIPRDADCNQDLCADMQGFSLHAAVRRSNCALTCCLDALSSDEFTAGVNRLLAQLLSLVR